MGEHVKRRRYESRLRRERAEATRTAVLDAARRLFTTRGYAATSVQDVAREAGVAIDTLYTAVGRKPELLLAVHDMLLAEADAPLAVEQRRYVKQMRTAETAEAKIRVYANALARLLPRTVPLLEALRTAAERDASCRAAYQEVSNRRARNMRRLVADLRSTGEMREEVSDKAAATLIWSMNSPEYFALLRDAGVSPRRYASLVHDVWMRTLLQPSAQVPAATASAPAGLRHSSG